MLKKSVKFLITAALTVSMIVPSTTVVFALDGHIVDATEGDREEQFGDIKTTEINDAALKINVDNKHKAVVTTGNLEAQNASAVEIEAKTGTADVTIDGDAVSWDEDNSSYGVSLYAGEDQNNTSADITLTVKGNTQGATAGTRVVATDGSTNNTVIEGSSIGIKNKEGDAFGLVVETRDDTNPGDREKAAKATVVVKGDCIATENTKDKGATIRGNGGFVDVAVGGNVSGDTGMEVQSFFGGVAKVVVKGTVYGEAVGISLDAEDGKNSDVNVWKVEAGKDGAIVGNLVEGKAVEDKNAEKKIKYIIKVEGINGAAYTLSDADGKPLPTVTSANGETFGYAHSGDKVFFKIDPDYGNHVDAVYSDPEKTHQLPKDDSGRYSIEVPVGGGAYFTADLSLKVPVSQSTDNTYEDYASVDDNLAAIVPGASSEGTGGKITKQKIDFSKVLTSDVGALDLSMTAIAGSKFTTTGKVKDKSSVKVEGGVKAKYNKKDGTVTVTCKKDGFATFTMDDDHTYKVKFTVEKPKPVKTAKKLEKGSAPTTKTLYELFGTHIDSGKLTIKKQKHSQASIENNALTINPAEKDTIKILYQYLNKKYKMTIKVK